MRLMYQWLDAEPVVAKAKAGMLRLEANAAPCPVYFPDFEAGPADGPVWNGVSCCLFGDSHRPKAPRAFWHDPPPLIAAKTGQPSCCQTCHLCRLQGCHNCPYCCIRLNPRQMGVALHVFMQSQGVSADTVCWVVVGNHVYDVRPSIAVFFDPSQTPHGVYTGMPAFRSWLSLVVARDV